jgi:hypothetical protein
MGRRRIPALDLSTEIEGGFPVHNATKSFGGECVCYLLSMQTRLVVPRESTVAQVNIPPSVQLLELASIMPPKSEHSLLVSGIAVPIALILGPWPSFRIGAFT